MSDAWQSDPDLEQGIKRQVERDWEWGGPITRLPEGYPVYCIYFPSGFDEPFENSIIEKLRTWGENFGKNIYVAPWKVGDPS